MKVNVYLASSIKAMQRKTGVVGYVLEAEHNTVSQFGKVENATENESVILDLKYALQRINPKSEIELYLDNGYVARAFEQGWLETWKKAEWKNAKGKEVANKEEWQKVAEILNGRGISVHLKEEHSYHKWLESEVERRARKYV